MKSFLLFECVQCRCTSVRPSDCRTHFTSLFTSCLASAVRNLKVDLKPVKRLSVKNTEHNKTKHKIIILLTFTALVAALLWPIPVNYFLLTCKPTSAQQHCPTNERFIVYISVSAFSSCFFLRNKQTSKNRSKKAFQSMERCPFLVWFVHWSTADTE